jgi:phosphonate transport system substrate-binding protein
MRPLFLARLGGILLALLAALPVKAEEDALVMGVFPRRSASETVELFQPIAAFLERELQRPVRLETAKDFDTFWQGVQHDRYDLVHYNQYHYLISHRQHGYQVILKNEELGEATIAGAILARKDSPYENLSDLKGKRIVFGGDPKAMQSYIVARYLLEQAGLKPGDYIEEFAKNPPNAIFSAFYGQADAAGAGDKVLRLDTVKNRIDIEQMRYLAVSEQMPHLPWAVKGTLPADTRARIQSLLAGLQASETGRKLLAGAKLSGLLVATDAEYDVARKIVAEVYDEHY